jgi:fructan beta-fructosidase
MKNNLIFIFAGIMTIILINACNMESTAPTDKKAYKEQHRPQFHFTPPSQWMNDPNGMVYYEGEYHLFYQHYPDSNVWGPMHWGHAVSKDMLHWKQLPIAIYPDSLGLIFSGSAVVDWKNTSGFGENGLPPLIAIYTYHLMEGEKSGASDFQYQAIAYSNDKGRTWTKYEGNPVIPNDEKIRDFRDPKVFWHNETEQWVMIFARGDRVRIYNSPNLKDWTLASEFGEGHGQAFPWECPDLFELPIEGTDQTKWVMLLSIGAGGKQVGPNGGSATQYFVGDFDGKTFTNDNDKDLTLWIDYGRDNYAGVTWSDIPEADGRRLFIGWMSNWEYATIVPTYVWRSAMTLPRTLALKQTENGIRLVTQPVKETQKLRIGKALEGEEIKITAGLESMVTFEMQDECTSAFGIELINSKGEVYKIGYNATTNEYFSDRTLAGKTSFSDKFAKNIHTAPRLTSGNIISFHSFFDVSSAETFTDDGLTILTDIYFPNEDFTTLRVFTDCDKVQVKSAKHYGLKGIWE